MEVMASIRPNLNVRSLMLNGIRPSSQCHQCYVTNPFVEVTLNAGMLSTRLYEGLQLIRRV